MNHVMRELALIFGVCLVGEAVEALLPVAFPASVISLLLLMALLLTGTVKVRQIKSVSQFLMDNMAFFFLPSFVGIVQYLDLVAGNLLPLLLIVGLTTPLVYLVTGWTVQLMLLRRRREEARHG